MTSDANADAWQIEIIELHEAFEAYFNGVIDTLDRVDDVLADDFTIVGPSGVVSSRAATMSALRAAHAHDDSLVIRTLDHRLLVESGELLVAEYIEEHQLATGAHFRLSTVVFSRSDAAVNGLVWRRVHETGCERGVKLES